MDYSNSDYINGLLNGDREVLAEIYRSFMPSIMTLVSRNGGNNEDAKDVFQTGLMVIYEKARSEDFNVSGSFGGLLYGICRNIWGNRLQKRSFQEVSLPEDVKYTIEDSWVPMIEQEERSKLLWDNLQRLGKDCQKLLKLFFSGKTMANIQEVMGFGSVSYASKRKFQCKERLIEMIKKDKRYDELR